MVEKKEIRFYAINNITQATAKDALYAVKGNNENSFKLYITDGSNNLIPLGTTNNLINIVSTDNSLIISGTSIKDLKLSQTLQNLINNSLQQGDAIPYIGATQNVDLGEQQIKIGQLELDQTPTETFGVGKIRWNDQAGTAEIRLKGNNVTLQIGQELVKRVVNKTTTNVNLLESNYQVVKIVGAQGQRLAIDLAQANNEINSATTLGVVTETINNNQEGFITYSGEINGINTTGSLQGETWTDGDVLYLSSTIAGRITNIKPSAPNHVVTIGYIEYSHSINGKIFVKVDNGYELSELHDVNTPSYINKGVLYRDTSTNTWKHDTIDNLNGEVIVGETPIGNLDGVNATFTTLNNIKANSEKLYINGHRQLKPQDYNISGQTLLLTFSPQSTESILIDYIKV